MDNKGLHIRYLNGDSQNFDPVLDFVETVDSLIFWCGGYDYIERLEDIQSWNFYDLCENCKYDIGYCKCEEL